MITLPKKVTFILDRIIFWIIAAILFLTPLFFLPFTPQVNEFSKQILLYALILLGYLAWFGKGIIRKKLIIRRTPLDLPILAFVLLYGLATIFSEDRTTSILGTYGQGAWSLISIIFYALFFFLIVSNIRSIKKIKWLGVSLIITSSILTIFFFLQIFNIFIIPFNFTKTNSYTPIGSMSALTIFIALILTLSTAFLLKNPLKFIYRVLLIILIFAELIALNTINFKIGWYLLLFSMFIILSFGLSHNKRNLSKKWLIIPTLILVLAIFATTLGLPSILKSKLPSEVSLGFGLSWNIARHTISQGFFHFLFGSGPETFGYDFSHFRPAEFNQNLLWNIRFDRGNNSYSEILATSGVLGIISYIIIVLVFIGSLSILFVKKKIHNPLINFHNRGNQSPPPNTLAGLYPSKDTDHHSLFTTAKDNLNHDNNSENKIKLNIESDSKRFSEIRPNAQSTVNLKPKITNESDEEEEESELTSRFKKPDFLTLGLITGSLILILANLLSATNTSLTMLFWTMTALSICLIRVYRPDEFKKTKLSFKTSPKYALLISFIFVLSLSIITVLFTYLGRIYLADVYHQKGINQITASKYDEATNNLRNAIKFNKYRPLYYLNMAQNLLTEANAEAAKGSAADINQVQSLIAESINKSKSATDLAPNNVNLWEARGQIYENTTLFSKNANEWVIKSYEKAQELEPTNPVFAAKLGRAYMIQASLAPEGEKASNYDQALEIFKRATELKPDYLVAHYYLALVYENKKQYDAALDEATKSYQIAPRNADIIYEIGRISYNKAVAENKEKLTDDPLFQKAINAFNAAIEINPNHANAHYSLGLTYENLGQFDQALIEMQKVSQLNPDNEQLKQKISDLESKIK